MDGLLLLQKKLEGVLSLIKSFGQEDLVKAGKVWNNFSLQLQSIINLDAEVVQESRQLSKSNKTKRSLVQQNNRNKARKIIVGTARKTLVQKSNAGESSQSQPMDGNVSTTPPANLLASRDTTLTGTATDSCSLEKEVVEIGGHLEEKVASLENEESHTGSQTKGLEKVEVETVLRSRLKTKQFICDECGATFSSRGNLNVHSRKHTGEKPFPCSKCSKRFNTSSNLRRHLLSHQGVKPYHCSMCDAKFTERKSLVNHVRRHTKETPFECTICGKAYRTRWVFSQHSKIHGGDLGKTHLCHQCGKSFTQKSQLKLHEKRIHVLLKTHICSYCDMPFTTKSDLRRHEITHSGGNNISLRSRSLGNDLQTEKEIDKSESQIKIVT